MRFVSPSVIALMLGGLLGVSAAIGAESDAQVPQLDPNEVFAYKGGVTLTQTEIDAVFSKLPEAERLAFIRDGGKVDQLVNSLLQRKLIARDAAAAGYDQQPIIAARIDLERQKELAEAWLQKIMQDAPGADFEALAYEHYLATPEAYRTEEVLDVSHILIGVDGRSDEDARKLADSLWMQLRADPSQFESMVEEYSDDPVKENNGGRYADMHRGMMVKPFENAAFALENPGDIGGPVKTTYGYHIIRLNGRSGNEPQEFSAVKEQAVADARRRYMETYRQNYLRRVLTGPVVIPEGAVEIMAKRHFGENLERAPDFSR